MCLMVELEDFVPLVVDRMVVVEVVHMVVVDMDKVVDHKVVVDMVVESWEMTFWSSGKSFKGWVSFQTFSSFKA